MVDRLSSLMDDVKGKSPVKEPAAANKLILKLSNMDKDKDEALSPFSLALKEQSSSTNKVLPIVEKPGTFLPNIASARQNAHLRDFKYTPENIEDYLQSNKGNKDIAKKHLKMDYSCSALP